MHSRSCSLSLLSRRSSRPTCTRLLNPPARDTDYCGAWDTLCAPRGKTKTKTKAQATTGAVTYKRGQTIDTVWPRYAPPRAPSLPSPLPSPDPRACVQKQPPRRVHPSRHRPLHLGANSQRHYCRHRAIQLPRVRVQVR
ncbi:hypothetical protein AMAG_06200 [Allomyces macrogynus ATCC 38327]|uniref:Uncharacterized protein n=1 Tax=Allomyces macrogynus (strain ATCC 38327) TaxID=578462 RepID=A0A0L0SFU7_ALLM3|nr:hypothetical protein AMAG_06200 [Allomyces macrogynus ATCC 38327]|eukprot:KNE61371.1 hypothetical protein AMAG_06200 [Allomyces macrogynus ATCC 38327]